MRTVNRDRRTSAAARRTREAALSTGVQSTKISFEDVVRSWRHAWNTSKIRLDQVPAQYRDYI